MSRNVRAWLLLLALGPLGSGLVYAQNPESRDEVVNSIGTQAAPHPAYKRTWKGDYQLEMGGEGFREARDEGVAAFFKIKSRFDLTFSPWLKARVEPRLVLFSSRLQSRYADDQYDSNLRAKNAYLSVRPVRHVELRAGALAQDYLENSLLVSRARAFPGLQQIASAEVVPGLKAQLILQQAVPTSTTLNPERNGKEPLPLFQTQSIHLKGRNVLYVDYDARVGHYAYSRLPDKVAFDSAVLGNSVPNGEVAAGSRFLYGFDGFFWGGTATVGSGRLLGEFEYQGVHNRLARADSADAQAWALGPKLYWRDQVITLKYGQHFIESDATVARYNVANLGHNNRLGQSVELRWAFTKQHFALRGEVIESRVIAPQNTQQNLSVFTLGVETDYASF